MFLRKEKNGYWNIYYLHHVTGKRTKVSTKTKNSVKAHEVYSKFKKDIENRFSGSVKSISVSELADKISSYKALYLTKSLAKSYKALIKDFGKFLGNSINMDKLKPEHVEEYNSELFNRNYKPGTIKQKMIMIKHAIEYAKEKNYINKNFSFGLIKIKTPKIEKGYLTKEQLLMLLKACKEKDLQDAIIVAFMTGMRRGELTNLTWDKVNIERKIITLNNVGHQTKSGEIRVIPLSDDVIAILKYRYLKKSNRFVFTYKGKKWTGHLFLVYKKLARKVFGKDTSITFHTLRHSFASNLLMENVPFFTVSKLLGHSNTKTTEIYSHLRTNDQQGVVNNLNIEKEKLLLDNTN